MKDGREMMVNIAWLVEKDDIRVLCSEPKKVNTIVRTILQDGDLKIANLGLYEHVRLSLGDINSPRELYIQLGNDLKVEPIKITRLQLL